MRGELERDINSHEINPSNLRRIWCPFKVICLVNFPDINQGDKVSVDAIKLTVEIKEMYIISGIAYHIAYFMITLE